MQVQATQTIIEVGLLYICSPCFCLHKPFSSSFLLCSSTDESKSKAVVALSNWGFPNHLSQTEQSIYHQFAKEIQKGNVKDWKDTLFCFGTNEEEEYAYCRWLRARKFNLDATLSMIEQATQLRIEAKAHAFYPDPQDALGVEESIFKSQYPQLFYSHAKNGCPVYITRPGALNMKGLECITTIENMNKYQWHCMVHSYAKVFQSQQKADPHFKRYSPLSRKIHQTLLNTSSHTIHFIPFFIDFKVWLFLI
jgi:hypothetical protein